MTKEILALQRRLKLHFENYDSLKNEEIYVAYKSGERSLTRDELDYLMCQAFCAVPQHAEHIILDSNWYLLRALNKVVDAKDAPDPQLEIIRLVVANRDKIDICDNWLQSVMHVYELIIRMNLSTIHADLQQIKHLKHEDEVDPRPVVASKPKATSKPPAPVVFRRSEPTLTADEYEEACNWVLKDFTALLF